jgi:Ni,Fe-hydrogenase III large subunit
LTGFPDKGTLEYSYGQIDLRERNIRTIDGLRLQIGDRGLLQKLEELDQFSEQDKATIKDMLNTFILKNRFQKLASPTEPQAALG